MKSQLHYVCGCEIAGFVHPERSALFGDDVLELLMPDDLDGVADTFVEPSVVIDLVLSPGNVDDDADLIVECL